MNALLLFLALRAAGELIPPPQLVQDVALADLIRMPNPEVTRAGLAFADEHMRWLRAQAEFDQPNAGYWQEWIEDAQECTAVWKHLDNAQREWHWEPYAATDDAEELSRRLDELRAVRDAIGPETYAAGRMPPVAPIWRFRRIP